MISAENFSDIRKSGYLLYKRALISIAVSFYTELRTVNMLKRQRDNTPPTSDDEEFQPKLRESDDEYDIRPPRRKRRAMVIYLDTESSDDEDDKICLLIILLRQSTRRNPDYFELKEKFQSNIKTFPDNASPYQFISRLFDRLVKDIK